MHQYLVVLQHLQVDRRYHAGMDHGWTTRRGNAKESRVSGMTELTHANALHLKISSSVSGLKRDPLAVIVPVESDFPAHLRRDRDRPLQREIRATPDPILDCTECLGHTTSHLSLPGELLEEEGESASRFWPSCDVGGVCCGRREDQSTVSRRPPSSWAISMFTAGVSTNRNPKPCRDTPPQCPRSKETKGARCG